MVELKNKLNIEIVEHNNEVLPILIRDVGVDFKAGEDVALVRFDTYADFLVPKDVPADELETLDHLIDSIGNQCWILPAVYRGYITKIFWFKPPWAHQFQDGKYQLQVGKCQETGLLKIASTYPYFTSNCVYSSNEKLSNIHTVDIYVSTAGLAKTYSTSLEKPQPPIYADDSGSESLDADNPTGSNRKKVKLSDNESSNRIYPLDAAIIDQLLESRQFLVDFDLSFFSTDDAIRKQFDEQEYEVLRYVYTRIVQDQSDIEIQRYIAARQSALEQIRTLMDEYLTDPKPEQTIVVDNPYLAALIAIIRYKHLDWKVIHDYGIHLSDIRPPLHVSSEEMVIYLIESMAKILQSIKKDPILITVSRCVDDGYCSLEQSNLIQKYLEKKLRKLYKINETIGKSLLDSDENDEEEAKDGKLMVVSDEGHSQLSSDEPVANASKTTSLQKHLSAMNENNHHARSPSPHSPSLSVPSPAKDNPSPGEIVKALSPSSLSEASPAQD